MLGGRLFLTIAVWCTLGLTAGLDAQVRRPTPKDVASRLRAKGNTWEALQILTQAWGPYPAAMLDMVADTLVAIAISKSVFPAVEGDDSRVENLLFAQAAVETLALSARPDSGLAYTGARSRLLRIAEADAWVAPGAVYSIAKLTDQASAIEALRHVAIRDAYAANVAIDILEREFGQAGIGILRNLYMEDLVVRPIARRRLLDIASMRGWRR